MTLSITLIRKAAEDPGAIQEWFAEKADRDVNESDFWGRTFLHYAAEKSQFEAMRYLLDRGADANAADEHGMTPLHFAARFGCPAAAALLLERGARVDQREGHDGTPLLLAVCFEDRDMIRLLLHRGADPEARDACGRNALAFADGCNKHKAAALLSEIYAAGGWRPYVRDPRQRLLSLRVLCELGRAETNDELLVRLFPARPKKRDGERRTRDSKKCVASVARTELPRGIFMHIFGYWRSSRDYDPSAPRREPDAG